MSVILAEFVSPFPTFSASLALNFLQIQPDCPDFSAVFVSACGTNTTYLSTESLFWWSILCMTLLISRNSVWLQSRLSMWYDIFFFILTKTFIYSETFLLRVAVSLFSCLSSKKIVQAQLLWSVTVFVWYDQFQWVCVAFSFFSLKFFRNRIVMIS